MQIVEVIRENGLQLVKLPPEFHIRPNTVSIRRQGEDLFWKNPNPRRGRMDFFEQIFIDDQSFVRPS